MFIIALIASYLAVLIALLTSQEVIVMVVYGLVAPALILVPRLLYRYTQSLKKRVNFEWVLQLEKLSIWVIVFNAAGSLYLHSHPFGFQYDRILHFMMGLLAVLIVGLLWLLKNSRVADTRTGRLNRILFKTGACVFVGLFAWELIQFVQDKFAGTQLFFDPDQHIVVDFWEDIIFGFVGLMAGLYIYAYKFKYYLNYLK